MRKRFLALTATLVLLLSPGAAFAQEASIDSYPLQQANIDQLAGQLVERGLVTSGDKVFIPQIPGGAGDETHFFHDTLISGLLHRGVTVQLREAGAKKALTYRWIRKPEESLHVHAFDINGRPDTTLKIRNRILCQVVELSTGAVLAGDFLISDTRPFSDQATAVMISTSAVTSSDSVSVPGSTLAQAAWEPKDQHGIGVTVSWVAGSGVSYRHWWQNGFGFQVAAVPLISYQNDSLSGLMNVGVQGMGPIVLNRTFRLFWLLGYGAAFDRGYFYNLSYAGKPDAYRLDQGVAPGVGLDLMITPNFALHAGLAYTVSYSGNSETGTLVLKPGFSPGGAIGSYFYF